MYKYQYGVIQDRKTGEIAIKCDIAKEDGVITYQFGNFTTVENAEMVVFVLMEMKNIIKYQVREEVLRAFRHNFPVDHEIR